MVTLEFFDGTKWIYVGTYPNEAFTWAMLGTDNYNYRTLDEKGNVLTDMSNGKKNK